MPITSFGKLIRKARIDAEVTLVQMACDLGVAPSFLSSLEHGTKKISPVWISKIIEYFESRKVSVQDIEVEADLSNGQVRISSLEPRHKRLVAVLANADPVHFLNNGELDFDRIAQYLKERSS